MTNLHILHCYIPMNEATSIYVHIQEEQIYIMDASAVNNVCNGTFYENKVLTKVCLVITMSSVATHYAYVSLYSWI